MHKQKLYEYHKLSTVTSDMSFDWIPILGYTGKFQVLQVVSVSQFLGTGECVNSLDGSSNSFYLYSTFNDLIDG